MGLHGQPADTCFYSELANLSEGGKVLEIGCGTGRILLPLARQGAHIDGLDYSPDILNELRKLLVQESQTTRDNVRLYHEDVRSFSLHESYELIIAPFRVLQHLYSPLDQAKAFQCIAAHLKPGGIFAFDVFRPDNRVMQDDGQERHEISWTDEHDSSLTIERYYKRTAIDTSTQVFEGEYIFRFVRGGRCMNEIRSAHKMSWYEFEQIQALLEHAGFEIEDSFGTFDKEPLSSGGDIIILAKKL